MLTQTDFLHAAEIIDGLNIPVHFGVNGNDDEFDGWYDLDSQIRDMDIGSFSIENGISKAVIIPADSNFVVKIPFNGIKYFEWDDEADEYSGDEYFEFFCCAEAPDQSDYCWDEQIKIEKAYYAGFGDLFPETAFVKEHDGTRFYIQEKVRTYSQAFRCGETPTVSENSRTKAKDMDSYYSSCNIEWRAAVIEFYGEEFWKSFVNWDSINCIGILTDMHTNNYGYTMDGRPVILDASGFRED